MRGNAVPRHVLVQERLQGELGRVRQPKPAHLRSVLLRIEISPVFVFSIGISSVLSELRRVLLEGLHVS